MDERARTTPTGRRNAVVFATIVVVLTPILLGIVLLSIVKTTQNSPALTTAPPQALGTQETLSLARRVIDGDTIELADGRVVRYIGVDAPEQYMGKPPECFAHEATAFNRNLVEGKLIMLEKDTSEIDRFGRLLRYVFVGEVLVNGELIKNGYAKAKAYPPDTRYRIEFEEQERVAKEENKGVWQACAQ